MLVRVAKFAVLTILASSLVFAAESAPTFKVTENLTLGEISRILYGTVKRAKEIATLNSLKNPDLILVGQVLKLPAVATNTEREQKATLTEIREKHAGVKPAPTVAQTPQAKAPEPAKTAETPTVKAAREELTRFIADEEANQSDAQKSSRATLLQGEEKLRAKDYKSAAKLFNESRAKNPGEISAWFQEIRSEKDSGDVASAKQTKSELLKTYPQFSEIPFLKGVQ